MCCINSTGVLLIQISNLDIRINIVYIPLNINNSEWLCYVNLDNSSYSGTNAESFDLIHFRMAHQMSAHGRVAFVVVMHSRGNVSKFTI